MLKYISVLLFSVLASFPLFSQEITATHDVQAGKNLNEFIVKTTIKGLDNVDIARVKYLIPEEHTFQASDNNKLFSRREDGNLKFYIMSVPETGIVLIEFHLIASSHGVFNFSVEFQYSVADEKMVINLPNLIIENKGALSPKIQLVGPPVREEIIVVEKIITASPAEEIVVLPPTTTVAPKEEIPVTPTVAIKPVTAVAVVDNDAKYGVQILALSTYSPQKVKDFCKANNLSYDKISILKVGNITKIRYGVVSRKDAVALKQDLLTRPEISDGFIVKLND